MSTNAAQTGIHTTPSNQALTTEVKPPPVSQADREAFITRYLQSTHDFTKRDAKETYGVLATLMVCYRFIGNHFSSAMLGGRGFEGLDHYDCESYIKQHGKRFRIRNPFNFGAIFLNLFWLAVFFLLGFFVFNGAVIAYQAFEYLLVEDAKAFYDSSYFLIAWVSGLVFLALVVLYRWLISGYYFRWVEIFAYVMLIFLSIGLAIIGAIYFGYVGLDSGASPENALLDWINYYLNPVEMFENNQYEFIFTASLLALTYFCVFFRRRMLTFRIFALFRNNQPEKKRVQQEIRKRQCLLQAFQIKEQNHILKKLLDGMYDGDEDDFVTEVLSATHQAGCLEDDDADAILTGIRNYELIIDSHRKS